METTTTNFPTRADGAVAVAWASNRAVGSTGLQCIREVVRSLPPRVAGMSRPWSEAVEDLPEAFTGDEAGEPTSVAMLRPRRETLGHLAAYR